MFSFLSASLSSFDNHLISVCIKLLIVSCYLSSQMQMPLADTSQLLKYNLAHCPPSWFLSHGSLTRILERPRSPRCPDFHLCAFVHATLSNCKLFHSSLYPSNYFHPSRHSLSPVVSLRPPWVAHSTFPSLNWDSGPLSTSSFVSRLSACINTLCLYTPSL